MLGLLDQNLYLLGETDKRINKACREWPKLKNSPKGMAMLYSYRAAIENNIIRNISLLGMERKPPPVKTLEEILAKRVTKRNHESDESAGSSESRAWHDDRIGRRISFRQCLERTAEREQDRGRYRPPKRSRRIHVTKGRYR